MRKIGVCLVISVIIIISIFISSHTWGSDSPLIRPLFTIERFHEESFDTPIGIFVDKERQEIYVADSSNNELFIFDTKGMPIIKFGKAQGISNPFDMVVKNNRIYLSQEGKSYVEIFSYRGEPIGRLAPPADMPFAPGRLAVDDQGKLYVINKIKSNCAVFDSKDIFQYTIGKDLFSLAGVAVTKDRVYLIRSFGERVIYVYDKEGNLIMAFEALQDQGGTLGLPVSGKIDKDGSLWLVDALRGMVIYDKNGKEITRFTNYGKARGQLFFPIDIDLDNNDMLYVVEKGAKRISVFKITPTLPSTIQGEGQRIIGGSHE